MAKLLHLTYYIKPFHPNIGLFLISAGRIITLILFNITFVNNYSSVTCSLMVRKDFINEKVKYFKDSYRNTALAFPISNRLISRKSEVVCLLIYSLTRVNVSPLVWNCFSIIHDLKHPTLTLFSTMIFLLFILMKRVRARWKFKVYLNKKNYVKWK